MTDSYKLHILTHSHNLSTGYFYILFLWAIAILDFRPLEIYKNLGLPLSPMTFTVNSHTDNHSYKYIYLFQILYSMKLVFLLKYTLRFWPRIFRFKFDLFWLKCGIPLSFFLIKTMVCRKRLFIEKKSFFAVDYVKIIELHIVHKWRHKQSE